MVRGSCMGTEDNSFPRLVSLACHDLRTPLATVQGFARTLVRMGGVGDPQDRYLGLIDSASTQLTELLEVLALAARIEGGRWEPLQQDADTFELAREAVEPLGEKAVVSGAGGAVTTDRDAVRAALHGLANAALRHGGLERVEVDVDGVVFRIGPVSDAAPVVLGEQLRDLGAAVGRMTVEALGGTVAVAGERLVVELR
jgi:signal transduction histidine kinase